jgi:hypothetical protein
MAGKVPFFLTGANARILLNNKTMAYATDVSYRVSVKHASPRVLGRFEVEVHQPLAYDVTGTLTVIRYARGLKDYYKAGAPQGVNNAGNGIGSMGLSSFGGMVGSALGLPSADGQWDGKADEAFNPSRFFQSKMFNIEIRQKVVDIPANKPDLSTIGAKVSNFFTQLDDAILSDPTNPAGDETSVVLLRDCRMEEMSFSLNKRGVATQTFTFRARYVDDDTFIARKSGVGQELS